MKLNAKYLPTQTAIETNPVYLHIQSLVVGMTSDFPISRPCYLFEKGMLVHEFSDMDRDFYDALYSPTRPLESDANVFFRTGHSVKMNTTLLCLPPTRFTKWAT